MNPELREVLASLSTGIYVLTTSEDTLYHGMSSSWVTQVSGVPPLLMAAVDSAHFSHAVIQRTGKFGLNILGRRGKALEDYFLSAASRRPDNLHNIEYELSPLLGVPWLKLAMASIEARVTHATIAGDHTLLVAELLGACFRHKDQPLTSLDLDYVYLGGKQVVARDRSGW